MPRHRYRIVQARVAERDAVDRSQRRRGTEPDRVLVINDSEAGGVDFSDEVGDDWNAFQERAYSSLIEYLNLLGEHGWLVITVTAQPNSTNPNDALLNSDFLFVRTD